MTRPRVRSVRSPDVCAHRAKGGVVPGEPVPPRELSHLASRKLPELDDRNVEGRADGIYRGCWRRRNRDQHPQAIPRRSHSASVPLAEHREQLPPARPRLRRVIDFEHQEEQALDTTEHFELQQPSERHPTRRLRPHTIHRRGVASNSIEHLRSQFALKGLRCRGLHQSERDLDHARRVSHDARGDRGYAGPSSSSRSCSGRTSSRASLRSRGIRGSRVPQTVLHATAGRTHHREPAAMTRREPGPGSTSSRSRPAAGSSRRTTDTVCEPGRRAARGHRSVRPPR